MSDIPTWHERAMRHPDHQTGMVSEDMIRARMCEEIADLRAEIERQTQHIEELRSKIDADRSCACSFDAPGDVCAAHSPALMQARAEVERLTRERDEARYFLKIFVHAHANNNAVPPHIEEQARKALEVKP